MIREAEVRQSSDIENIGEFKKLAKLHMTDEAAGGPPQSTTA
jgi:hypothetical protein